MSKSNSNIWETFMQSEFAQKQLEKIEKKAQHFSDGRDRDGLYNVAPASDTQLGQSVTTQGVNAGGASMVGSEDRGPLYTTTPAAVPGGQEQYADATVEGLEDTAKAMMDVAMKAPTANPRGSQDNHPESWDGIQAAGNSQLKNFTKSAQDMMMDKEGGEHMMAEMMASDDDASLEKILSELEEEGKEEEDKDEEAIPSVMISGDKMMEAEHMMHEASSKKKTIALLKELVKIATECDEKGLTKDANEIDAVIKSEVKTLLAASKKLKK